MPDGSSARVGDNYILPTGEKDAARLDLIHQVYGPAGEQAVRKAGIPIWGRVADIGCGTGPVSMWLAKEVGPGGRVDAIDIDASQLAIARSRAKSVTPGHINFTEASAYEPGLPLGVYDLVFSRFLLCHLQRPEDALHRMVDMLKPGGHLVVVDIDLPTMFTIPPSDVYAEAAAYGIQAGKARGVDYQIGLRLPAMFSAAGLENVDLSFSQPTYLTGGCKKLWETTFRNAAPSAIASGAASQAQFDSLFERMAAITADEKTWVAHVRCSVVTGRKPL